MASRHNARGCVSRTEAEGNAQRASATRQWYQRECVLRTEVKYTQCSVSSCNKRELRGCVFAHGGRRRCAEGECTKEARTKGVCV